MSETFNSVIIGPRHKPIVTMFEEIIGYLMERWAFNRTRFDSYNGSVLPNIKKKLDKERELSRFWRCRIAGEKIYDVILIRSLTTEKYIVDLTKMECTCRRWMLTGIPCCHAITCYIDRREDPENAIPLIYRKEAYQAVYNPIIYPTNGENLWVATPHVDILPPPLRRGPGRPKRSRNKDADEKRSETGSCTRKGWAWKCSKCKQFGHNKLTCKGPSQTATSQTANSQNVQTQTIPTQTGPSQTSPIQTNASQTAAIQTAPNQTNASQTAPPKQKQKQGKKPSQTSQSKQKLKQAKQPAISSSQPAPQKSTASSFFPTSSSQPAVDDSRRKLTIRR